MMRALSTWRVEGRQVRAVLPFFSVGLGYTGQGYQRPLTEAEANLSTPGFCAFPRQIEWSVRGSEGDCALLRRCALLRLALPGFEQRWGICEMCPVEPWVYQMPAAEALARAYRRKGWCLDTLPPPPVCEVSLLIPGDIWLDEPVEVACICILEDE